YLLFPFLAVRVQRLRTSGACLGIMLLCWLASMLPPVLVYSAPFASMPLNDCVKFNPLLRLGEFCVGICLGKIFLQKMRAKQYGPSPAAPALILTTILIGLVFNVFSSVPKLLLHNG